MYWRRYALALALLPLACACAAQSSVASTATPATAAPLATSPATTSPAPAAVPASKSAPKPTATIPPPTATIPPPTATPQVSPAAGTGAACTPTPPSGSSASYVPGAPVRSSVGKGHVLHGVITSNTDCKPVAGVRVEVWLVAPNADYDAAHRATLFTDAGGQYRFESNFPPPYPGRPPHIHIRVSAQGYRTLVTQFYPAKGEAEGEFDIVLKHTSGTTP